MKIDTIVKIDYVELETILHGLFPKANMDYPTDSNTIHRLENINKGNFYKKIKQVPPHYMIEFLQVISGGARGYFTIQTLVEYLVWLDLLPEGDYIIKIHC